VVLPTTILTKAVLCYDESGGRPETLLGGRGSRRGQGRRRVDPAGSSTLTRPAALLAGLDIFIKEWRLDGGRSLDYLYRALWAGDRQYF
jgi:hypothetical protein